MKRKKVVLPLNNETINDLKAGDSVLLDGIIYVARDAAHKRIVQSIKEHKALPFDLKSSIIYYMGPTPTPNNEVIGSAGPTTSYRMDQYTPLLLDLGLKGMIGKGNRSIDVINSLVKNKSVYFVTTGGTGALIQSHIKRNQIIAYNDLGPEAILKLEVESFPAIVAIDSKGNNLFETENKKFKERR